MLDGSYLTKQQAIEKAQDGTIHCLKQIREICNKQIENLKRNKFGEPQFFVVKSNILTDVLYCLPIEDDCCPYCIRDTKGTCLNRRCKIIKIFGTDCNNPKNPYYKLATCLDKAVDYICEIYKENLGKGVKK